MNLSRRGFLGGMLAASIAPAFVKSESLMKVIAPKIIIPDYPILYGDGINNDTFAFQAMLDGLPVMTAAGVLIQGMKDVVRLPAGTYNIKSSPVFSGEGRMFDGSGSRILGDHIEPVMTVKSKDATIMNFNFQGNGNPLEISVPQRVWTLS